MQIRSFFISEKNSCLEFKSDTEEALVQTLELAASSFILELTTIHLQEMASRRQCAPDAGQIRARPQTIGDRKFGNVVMLHRILAGEMELALQVTLGDLHISHG